jgi:hypothetical protein
MGPPYFPETFVSAGRGSLRNYVTRVGAWEHHPERLVLPKSVGGGNLGRNKLVIRWLPV